MTDMVRFGAPDLFEIAACWAQDDEPRERRPLDGGWSAGHLAITVGGHTLTARSIHGQRREYVAWYLAPLFEWLLSSWTSLFHEEAFAWSGAADAPAAPAVSAAALRHIASADAEDRATYQSVHAWWSRHALRAADPSALYPDICLRRLGDTIEISWTSGQPVHRPDGFTLTLLPGVATLPVSAVARPLWQFLKWGLHETPVHGEIDSRAIAESQVRFRKLASTPVEQLEAVHLGERLNALLRSARRNVSLERTTRRVHGVPVVEELDAAVLMFGGLSPQIDEQDATRLLAFLAKHQNGREDEALRRLVDDTLRPRALAAHEEGYALAEHLRERLGRPRTEGVNVELTLRDLRIDLAEQQLDTDTIRGVAIAGPGFSPAILVNTSSVYNNTRDGRRFTMAHELCHILFDRAHARRISHVSGMWTTGRVERRANAFAVMFLAPRNAVERTFRGADIHAVSQQAKALGIGLSALIEHLHNLRIIDEAERTRLRLALESR